MIQRWIWLLFCFGFWGHSVSAAVTFETGVNRDTLTVGDLLIFRIRIRKEANDRTEIVSDNVFPGRFEVREARPPAVQELEDGRIEEIRDLILTVFETGDLEIPALTLQYVLANGDLNSLRSHPIPVTVQSVKPEGVSDIQDVKPPVEIQARIPIWAWVVLGGIVLIVAGLIWYFIRRKRKPKEEPPPPPVNWVKELDRIGQLGLLEQENYKQYYTLISDTFRRFLEEKVGVEAMEHTTFEIARDLAQAAVKLDMIQETEAFLSEADLVKFAKFTPDLGSAKDALPRVRQLVLALDRPPAISETEKIR